VTPTLARAQPGEPLGDAETPHLLPNQLVRRRDGSRRGQGTPQLRPRLAS
jgi:hypothetical protein